MTGASPAWGLMTTSVWSEAAQPGTCDEAVWPRVRRAAQRHHAAARLARVYPDRMKEDLQLIQARRRAYLANLTVVTERLDGVNVRPVLIKSDFDEDCAYGDFDLVVGRDCWERAVEVLSTWTVQRNRHWMEPGKLHLVPIQGPSAHLHQSVAWFGITVIDGEKLKRRGLGTSPWLTPRPADALRVALAHAVFQTLVIDLPDLLSIRRFVDPTIIDEARCEAGREGWRWGFDATLGFARDLISAFDGGGAPKMPRQLPLRISAVAPVQHALHLGGSGHPGKSLHEISLRPALLLAKHTKSVDR
jgi:hypothetical protein